MYLIIKKLSNGKNQIWIAKGDNIEQVCVMGGIDITDCIWTYIMSNTFSVLNVDDKCIYTKIFT